MSTAVDRDLLFGLLALQNGLIDQVQLVAAFQARTRDRATALAEHLVVRGDLDAEQRAAVEAIVALHLTKHGDAERTLATIPGGRSMLNRLAAIGDPELSATVACARTDTTQAGSGTDADRTVTYAVGEATADGRRFRVLRPHARGGLGAVFVAMDTELNREVALKQILDQHAHDPVSRQRFVLEAEVTGGLEHPGIVPVYGLGTYGDGRPYYAMRLIRGDTLKEAVERFHGAAGLVAGAGRRTLELRMLLRRFLDVCNAVDYAHSRGVLHRDLKPANVVLGKHGETLLVDWGLAKARGRRDGGETSEERTLVPSSSSGSSETLPGQALGTPAYMSPEQARGDLGALGPTSDVYSLGATLYCLLTGRPPLEGGDVAEVMRRVREGDFPRPREVNRGVPPALEAVVLRAMAPRPAERFRSARELAEEVERWLADEPVAAYRDPPALRLARWGRRHRTSVVGLASLLLTAVVALGIGTALLRRANDRTERRRQEATVHLGQAERNFRLARDAVDEFFTRVSQDRLLNEPRMGPLRRDLLELASRFYRRFIDERRGDPRSRDDLGHASLRLGRIEFELGAPLRAIEQAAQARAIFEALARHEPNKPEYRLAWARSLEELGLYHRYVGDLAAAERSLSEAFSACERLVRDDPRDESARRSLASVCNELANALKDLGRRDEAAALLVKTRATWEAIVRAHPAEATARNNLATVNLNLGLIATHDGRPEDAKAEYGRAQQLWEALAAEYPGTVEYRFNLAKCFNDLGIIALAAGRTSLAEDLHGRELSIYDALARDQPEVNEHRQMLALAHRNLAMDRAASGHQDAAVALLAKALAIWEDLIRSYPELPHYRFDLAHARLVLGRMHGDAGRLGEALHQCERALEDFDALCRAFPEQAKYQAGGAIAADQIGNIHDKAGRPFRALESFRMSRAAYESLTRAHPGDLRYCGDAAWLGRQLMWMYYQVGQLDEAIRAAARAGDQYAAVLRGKPGDGWAIAGAADCQSLVAMASARTGRSAEAWEGLRRMESLLRLLPRDEPIVLYDAASAYAQLGLLNSPGEPSPGDASSRGREDFYLRSVVTLRRAIAAGYGNLTHLQSDRDFDPVRDRDDFRVLLMDLSMPAWPFTPGG